MSPLQLFLMLLFLLHATIPGPVFTCVLLICTICSGQSTFGQTGRADKVEPHVKKDDKIRIIDERGLIFSLQRGSICYTLDSRIMIIEVFQDGSVYVVEVNDLKSDLDMFDGFMLIKDLGEVIS